VPKPGQWQKVTYAVPLPSVSLVCVWVEYQRTGTLWDRRCPVQEDSAMIRPSYFDRRLWRKRPLPARLEGESG